MMSNNRNGDQQFNGPFDQWLREHRPPQPAFSQDMDAFLEEFQFRMAAEQKARSKRQKRNLKRGSTVMIVALLSIAVFNLPELGGDGFNMVEVEDAQTPGGVVKNEFRGDGFNILEGETAGDIRATNQELAAGSGEVVSLEGLMINGKTEWSIIKEYYVNGKIKVITHPPDSITSETSKEHYQFLLVEWGDVQRKIANGSIPQSGVIEKEIDGVKFQIKTWEFLTKNSKKGIFYRGTPIR
jgi:hypothetical protein